MIKKIICLVAAFIFLFLFFSCLTDNFYKTTVDEISVDKVYDNNHVTEGDRAAAAAAVYLNVPRNVLDCSAFTQKAYSDIGLSIPRVTYEQAGCGVKIFDYESLEPGDIICMGDGSEPENISHVGIYCGNDKMLHSSLSKGKIIEVSLSDWIKNGGYGTPFQYAVRIYQ